MHRAQLCGISRARQHHALVKHRLYNASIRTTVSLRHVTQRRFKQGADHRAINGVALAGHHQASSHGNKGAYPKEGR